MKKPGNGNNHYLRCERNQMCRGIQGNQIAQFWVVIALRYYSEEINWESGFLIIAECRYGLSGRQADNSEFRSMVGLLLSICPLEVDGLGNEHMLSSQLLSCP